MAAHVLVVDDEPAILRMIQAFFSQEGMTVTVATSGEEALDLFDKEEFDVAILDIVLPGIDGIETMQRIRQRSGTPVILLTARNRDSDKIQGLNQGADDYVAKPFSPEELSARVRAVLRRTGDETPQEPVFRSGDLEIDLGRRIVSRGGTAVALSRTEWNLLQILAEHPGKAMLSAELLERLAGPAYRVDPQYLRVWVSRLRAKLEEDPSNPKLIINIPRVGYRFNIE